MDLSSPHNRSINDRVAEDLSSLQYMTVEEADHPTSVTSLQDKDSITLKELLPIVFACGVWGPAWQNSQVLVQGDNQGAVAVVNSGYSKVQAVMHSLRCLFFI